MVCSQGGTLNVELYNYFRALRPSYRTAILSNSFVGAREREQEAYGLSDSCDLIIYSHEVGMSKPDPRIYELTCERLGVRPHEMIFVDDAEANIVAARSLDIYGVQFRTNEQVIADTRALTDAEGGDEPVDKSFLA
ncbi:MAG TPA: hypothetical protein DGG94_18865 [Micromonosporaceae bacterium]|nr:hypothetical protein [Micromonosporaceae bacterium]HCU51831.1 hypothetical protein [Micromonosporaceae bacterium]